MTILGVLFGVGLVLAARAFQTDQDPRLQAVLDELPGINCGACGYAGCQQYGEAVLEGEDIKLCVPGGPDCAAVLASIMGLEAEEQGEQKARLRAVVHCQGGRDKCGERFEYVGVDDCQAADLISGGPKACSYGCLGEGSCAKACPFGAIVMNEERLPVIDPDKCTACGICVATCPRDIISLVPVEQKIFLGCSSHDRGRSVKDICAVGCTACTLCARKDPNEAIVMEENLPVLDYEKAKGDFSVAADVCPMSCFVVEQEPETVAASAEKAEQNSG